MKLSLLDCITVATWREVYRYTIDNRTYRIWRTHKNDLFVMWQETEPRYGSNLD